MSMHRLGLIGSEKKQRKVDVKVLTRFFEGKIRLDEALELDSKAAAGLRRQAHALYESGKWQQCIDVILGLAAVGDVDPFDPLLMAGAYTELGNAEAARLCTEMGEKMLETLDGLLRAAPASGAAAPDAGKVG